MRINPLSLSIKANRSHIWLLLPVPVFHPRFFPWILGWQSVLSISPLECLGPARGLSFSQKKFTEWTVKSRLAVTRCLFIGFTFYKSQSVRMFWMELTGLGKDNMVFKQWVLICFPNFTQNLGAFTECITRLLHTDEERRCSDCCSTEIGGGVICRCSGSFRATPPLSVQRAPSFSQMHTLLIKQSTHLSL